MRILFLSSRSPYPPNCGHALRTYNLIREAVKKHDITLVSYVLSQDEETGIREMEGICSKVVSVPVPIAKGRSRLYAGLLRNLFSDRPFLAHKYGTPLMTNTVRELLRDNTYDLVHIDTLWMAVHRHAVKGLPVVVSDHNVEYRVLEKRAGLESGIARRFWSTQARRMRNFEIRVLNESTCTVAVSDADTEGLRQLVPAARVFTVPNGVDVDFFQPDWTAPRKNVVVFVGNMDYQPNVDAVRYFTGSIWPMVHHERPDSEFVVIGARPPAVVRKCGEIPGVKILGFVDDVRPYLQTASVYVAPLRVGGGTKLKVLTAMACGAAIVSSPVGAEGIDFENGREMWVEDTPESTADRILAVLRNPNEQISLGMAGRCLVERLYSWPHIGEINEAVYQTALKMGPVGSDGKPH